MRVLPVILIVCGVLAVSDGAKILAVFSMGAHSHFTLGFKLAKELADRGHDVTLINAYPQKTPIKNLKEISVAEMRIIMDEQKKGLFDMGTMTYLGQLRWVSNMGNFYTDHVLKNKDVQKLLNSNEQFDLVLMEDFVNKAMTIFAHRFNCPLIILAPGPTTVFNNDLFVNPSPSSYVPNFLANFGSSMTFWQRLKNTYYDIVGQLFLHYVLLPEQDAILKEAVPNAPDLKSIIYNASLMLTASHISLRDAAPLQPNIKEIGGYHVGPLKQLPKDLQEFLDNANEGVIVFSMGSNLKSADFPKAKKDAVLKTFANMKQKVLWKFEDDLPEKPDNLKIMSWIPQQEVLAHPNVILFITHVGLLGTIEAIYHGVPLLGLPVFWDQEKNIEEAVLKGFGLKISFPELNVDNFAWAVNELVSNPKYRQTAKTRSKIMHDQPVKQMDEAMFWIEYVIRHKGAPHLRSPGLNLRWYQLHLVDVALFVLSSITVLFVGIFCACKRVFSGKHEKSKKE
ncbi:hypothetical protein NQ318_011394 [Aromia moschata]|uniref:UDP-glucuronosyltransferase n=1 Tax=Aromia moschata TaxID=1265417 RepID=A0AAV8YT46_9CUCU|nr:hypothetical protein NQ318_011394 [Aromia moschata]